MPTTPNGLPYPALTDTPDVPYWMQQLAEALDAALFEPVAESSIHISTSAGWTVSTANGKKIGRVTQVTLTFTRTGAPISGTASGNITNENVCVVGAGWRPVENAPLSPRDTGPLASGFILTDGTVGIAALGPGNNIATGDVFTLSGTFIGA